MSNLVLLPLLSIFLMISVAAMPMINPITPRINSDLLAFLGLGLFGWATHWSLPHENRRFGFNGLSLLCGFWLVLACAQYALQINTAYFSHFLISISYLVAVVLLTAWVRMWTQAGKVSELAQAFMLAVLAGGLMTAIGVVLQMLGWQDFLSPLVAQVRQLSPPWWLFISTQFGRFIDGLRFGEPDVLASQPSEQGCSALWLAWVGHGFFALGHHGNQLAHWLCRGAGLGPGVAGDAQALGHSLGVGGCSLVVVGGDWRG